MATTTTPEAQESASPQRSRVRKAFSRVGLIGMLAAAVIPLQAGSAFAVTTHDGGAGGDYPINTDLTYTFCDSNGRCLNVLGGGDRSGTGVGLYPGPDDPNSQWRMIPRGTDAIGQLWQIENRATARWLDLHMVRQNGVADPQASWIDQVDQTTPSTLANTLWYVRWNADRSGMLLVNSATGWVLTNHTANAYPNILRDDLRDAQYHYFMLHDMNSSARLDVTELTRAHFVGSWGSDVFQARGR
ncbi:RICIN domain-containing protein [Streptoverticillium reticulum]|uniref:RICIN domain-containing protein n=1 Tax=Streptoverticillium reticulum TaxID=1433415 RepID=UPI0039BF3C8E